MAAKGPGRHPRRTHLVDAKPRTYDLVCFHCQQAAEKFLKGFLYERGVAFKKTHILEDLIDLCLPIDATFFPLRPIALGMTRFAVEYRYPASTPADNWATSALTSAERIRAEFAGVSAYVLGPETSSLRRHHRHRRDPLQLLLHLRRIADDDHDEFRRIDGLPRQAQALVGPIFATRASVFSK